MSTPSAPPRVCVLQRNSRSFRQWPCLLTISSRRERRASACSRRSMPNCVRTLPKTRSSVAASASCSGASKCTRMKNRPVPSSVTSPNCCEATMLQPAWYSSPATACTMPCVSRHDRVRTNWWAAGMRVLVKRRFYGPARPPRIADPCAASADDDCAQTTGRRRAERCANCSRAPGSATVRPSPSCTAAPARISSAWCCVSTGIAPRPRTCCRKRMSTSGARRAASTPPGRSR